MLHTQLVLLHLKPFMSQMTLSQQMAQDVINMHHMKQYKLSVKHIPNFISQMNLSSGLFLQCIFSFCSNQNKSGPQVENDVLYLLKFWGSPSVPYRSNHTFNIRSVGFKSISK
jgi:hypothetical protein